ncbi:hypothetical protein F4802DRAFT_197455 [Xylaria palmicola]|nr:hypothetical protein F4802DRAFT_197455 [Xylaria palmicola]
MGLEVEARDWHQGEFLVSTRQDLIQVDAVRDAMDSDVMWWAQALPIDVLRKALGNSMCLGLYELPQSSGNQIAPKQIGLMRVITDDVTFAYLTDVYILPEYQGKGLGRWMLACLDEVIKAWPHLRRFVFMSAKSSLDLYRKALGAHDWDERENRNLVLGNIDGPASRH